jgi:hypothetical protein
VDDLDDFGVADGAASGDLPLADDPLADRDPRAGSDELADRDALADRDKLAEGDPRWDDPSAAEILAELAHTRPKSPDDPVLARLFPDGYRDDPEAAAELRGLIEEDLRTQKLENVNTLLATLPLDGGQIRLDGEQAEAWLLALNDARLVVGTRLDVTDDMDILDELDDAVLRDPTGPRVFALSVYQLLGYLQESLVDALSD